MSLNQARNWQNSHVAEQETKQVTVKVRKQSWTTKGEKFLYALVGTSIIAACMFTVSYSSTTDDLNRKLQAVEKSTQNQQLENEGLKFEIKELSRPERIIKIAKQNGLKIQDTAVKQVNPINN